MASSPPTSPLRQLFETTLSQLTGEVEALFTETRDRARRDLAEQLNQSVRHLRQSADTEELANTLVAGATAFASGAAFFRVADGVARGERIRGVSEEQAGRFPGLTIPLASAAALAGAVETRDPVIAAATPAEVSPELMEVAGHGTDARVAIFPVLVRDGVRALLYTWNSAGAAELELLCQMAAAVWAGMEPVTVTVAAPAPELVQIAVAEPRPRPTWESLPTGEQQLHLKAQRFARVQAAELRLREGQAVQAGRARRDLYGALREPVDAARAKYREAFFTKCPSMVDYLHLELLRTLANDEAELLGKDYPGPLV
jgi:hypothetical protein